MMKIQMTKTQPRPGAFPALPCYLAGQTYELATEAEVAMGKQFLADGVAVAIADEPAEVVVDVPAATASMVYPAPKAKPKK